jgi:protein AroM
MEAGRNFVAGVLTIGQSPRADDMSAEVAKVAGLEVIERGALDGLTHEEVSELGPRPGGELLVSELADGTPVRLDRDAILERLQQRIAELEGEGVGATLLLCTGEFPPFAHSRPLLVPSAALRGAVVGMAGTDRVASMLPVVEQAEQARCGWGSQGIQDPILVVADPYCGDAETEVARQAGCAAQLGAGVLFLDCFGYSLRMAQVARDHFPGPVVLARSLAARMLAEMAGA